MIFYFKTFIYYIVKVNRDIKKHVCHTTRKPVLNQIIHWCTSKHGQWTLIVLIWMRGGACWPVPVGFAWHKMVFIDTVHKWVSRKEIGISVIYIRNIIQSFYLFIITVANSNVLFVSSQKWVTAKSLIRQTGEAGDRTRNPWLLGGVVYPFQYSGSYSPFDYRAHFICQPP